MNIRFSFVCSLGIVIFLCVILMNQEAFATTTMLSEALILPDKKPVEVILPDSDPWDIAMFRRIYKT